MLLLVDFKLDLLRIQTLKLSFHLSELLFGTRIRFVVLLEDRPHSEEHPDVSFELEILVEQLLFVPSDKVGHSVLNFCLSLPHLHAFSILLLLLSLQCPGFLLEFSQKVLLFGNFSLSHADHAVGLRSLSFKIFKEFTAFLNFFLQRFELFLGFNQIGTCCSLLQIDSAEELLALCQLEVVDFLPLGAELLFHSDGFLQVAFCYF